MGIRGVVSRAVSRVSRAAAPVARVVQRAEQRVAARIAPVVRPAVRQPPTVRPPARISPPARSITRPTPISRPAPRAPARAAYARPASPFLQDLPPAAEIGAGGLEFVGQAEDYPVVTPEEVMEQAPQYTEEVYDTAEYGGDEEEEYEEEE